MDTTTRTRMFARVIGPYFVIVSLTAALRAPDMQAVLSDFEASPVWPWFAGVFTLLLGLVIVALHSYWTDPPAVIVSARPRMDFHTHLKALQRSITAVADCRTPTIASIHGWCIGGGVDLISAVDIRYASADAKFSVREVKLSIVADVGSLARLPYILSDGHLRELALTGKDIDAARAEKIGLVNEVLPDAEATLTAAHGTAAEIAANSPLVTRGIKDVLDEQRTADVAASLRYVAAWNSAFLPSRDLKEGISAMFAKREPNFTGE